MRFSGKVAIASGAGSGMGRLTCERLAAEGASVVLCDVNLNAAEEAAAEIRKSGARALAIQTDVRDYASVKAAVDCAKREFGSVDYVLNFAGGASSRVFGVKGGFAETDISIIDWGLDVNLKGPVYFAHAALPHMFSQNSGVIVNLGSITGEEGSAGAIDYSAAKSGVMYGLTKSLAQYAAPHGVRVVCVSPGPVLTRAAMANMRTLVGRAARPEEVVDLILYLCSDKAEFITGVNYMIDGGRSCLQKA